MSNHDVIVIGASAGGVEALTRLVRGFPRDLPAAVFVVVHFPGHSTSLLPKILSRSGLLPAKHPKDRERIQENTIYVAPPDFHMLVEDGIVRTSRGPKVNGFRPAIDTLFYSAAVNYGRRVVGAILSGSLDDGVMGLKMIRNKGGIAIVQEPSDAIFPTLPMNTIQRVDVNDVLTIPDMAAKMKALVKTTIPMRGGDDPMHRAVETDQSIIQEDISRFEHNERMRYSSLLTCPECGGVMWEVGDGEVARYSCHVGHSYSEESIYQEQGETLEAALWTAVRALEERAALIRRLARMSKDRGSDTLENRYLQKAVEVEQNADLIRDVIYNSNNLSTKTLLSEEEEPKIRGDTRED